MSAGLAHGRSPAVVPPVVDGLEVPAACMDLMVASHDKLHRLQFRKAEDLARQAVELYPNHPLTHLFLSGVFFFEIQENELVDVKDPRTFKEFYKSVERGMELTDLQLMQWPESGYPLVYKGALRGSVGMVKVFQGKYLSAYFDGKEAIDYLREAVKKDPANDDVYFGIGQFEYYCGKLAGVLQWVLRLKGDEDKGIAYLKRSAENGTYTVLPSIDFLGTIYGEHRQDWKNAKKYIYPQRDRFPENYHFFDGAIKTALGIGLQDPESVKRLEDACAQWDTGWRPPPVSGLDIAPARLELASHYIASGKKSRPGHTWSK